MNVFSIALSSAIYYFYEAIFAGAVFADPGRAYNIVSYAWFVGFNIYYWYLIYIGLSRTVVLSGKTKRGKAHS